MLVTELEDVGLDVLVTELEDVSLDVLVMDLDELDVSDEVVEGPLLELEL